MALTRILDLSKSGTSWSAELTNGGDISRLFKNKIRFTGNCNLELLDFCCCFIPLSIKFYSVDQSLKKGLRPTEIFTCVLQIFRICVGFMPSVFLLTVWMPVLFKRFIFFMQCPVVPLYKHTKHLLSVINLMKSHSQIMHEMYTHRNNFV